MIEIMKQPTLKTLQKRCADWNARFPVGTAVEYHPVIGEAAHRPRKTRTEAQVLSGHMIRLFGLTTKEGASTSMRWCPSHDARRGTPKSQTGSSGQPRGTPWCAGVDQGRQESTLGVAQARQALPANKACGAMSGSYTESFGTRMKKYPRRRGQVRSRGWYRVRAYHPIQGARTAARVEPWIYFQWDQPISALDRFTRAVATSYRDTEYLGADRPAGISESPFKTRPGDPFSHWKPTPLFLEKL